MYYQKENPHGGDVYSDQIVMDFSANINPLGAPPGALAAAGEALLHAERYPDPCCSALVSAIAAAEGVLEQYILCGNGAAELIYSYCAACGALHAVELAPTFCEYTEALTANGCAVERYMLSPETDFLPDMGFLEFLRQRMPDVVFLCNPNNPTGRAIPPKLLAALCAFSAESGVRLFVDECFVELSDRGDSLRAFLAAVPGLFLLRAFTKSYGLAGLRLGYGLCADTALLSRMAERTPPWNVSGPAQAAGAAALRESAFLEESRALIRAGRGELKRGLEDLGMQVCPSEANFLLFRGPANLDRALRARGTAIRSCWNFPGLGPDWYRVAVRRPEENRRLLLQIRECLSRQPGA